MGKKNSFKVNRRDWIFAGGIFFIALIGLTLFFYNWAHGLRIEGLGNDLVSHSNAAREIYEAIKLHGFFEGLRAYKAGSNIPHIVSYPVWHFLVIFFYRVFSVFFVNSDVALDFAGALVNGLFTAGMVPVLYFIFALNSSLKNRIFLVILALSLIFVGPFNMTGIDGYYYPSAYTPNPWHNPTYLVVRLLGLVVFFLYVRILKEKDAPLSLYIFSAVLLALSAFFKPSFYQGFLPGLVVYCLGRFFIKPSLNYFEYHLKIAATCVPVGIIALLQLFSSVGGEGGGIGVGFLYVWKNFTSNFPLSFLFSFGFIVAGYVVFGLFGKWDEKLSLSLAFLISATFQYMFFYLKAAPFTGDFGWAMMLSMFVSTAVIVQKVLEIWKTFKPRMLLCILFIVYIGELFFGISYFVEIILTKNFMAPL